MITNSNAEKSLAGYSWEQIYNGMLVAGKLHGMDNLSQYLCPTADFCLYMTRLMEEVATHPYPMTVDQAFSWLFVSAVYWWEAHTGLDEEEEAMCERYEIYSAFIKLLAPEDYELPYLKAIRRELYNLYLKQFIAHPFIALFTLQCWKRLTRGVKQPRFKETATPFDLYRKFCVAMPPFYFKDVCEQERAIRAAIFDILPLCLGKFSQPVEIAQK